MYIHMIAVVFLTRRPAPVMLEFIEGLAKPPYDIYVSVDDMDYVPPKGTPVQYIQYGEEECIRAGYKNALLPWHMWRPSAWEKALYHFCVKDTRYEHVWFIEDDVLITSEDVLHRVDTAYPSSDLLCEAHIVVNTYKRDWHWQLAHGKIGFPWAKSMMCACRLSARLLQAVAKYVKYHSTLLYHEFMFNTLAIHGGMKVDIPDELSGITYQYKWKMDEFEVGGMYHPVKEVHLHSKLRQLAELRSKMLAAAAL